MTDFAPYLPSANLLNSLAGVADEPAKRFATFIINRHKSSALKVAAKKCCCCAWVVLLLL